MKSPSNLESLMVLALGSNVGDRVANLESGRKRIAQHFCVQEVSQIYSSAAVDFVEQPDFLNQVISTKLPDIGPQEVLEKTQAIEKKVGSLKPFPKGPRALDIDLLFFGTKMIDKDQCKVPHPRWAERSFVVLPLKELSCYESIKNFTNIKEIPPSTECCIFNPKAD